MKYIGKKSPDGDEWCMKPELQWLVEPDDGICTEEGFAFETDEPDPDKSWHLAMDAWNTFLGFPPYVPMEGA